MGVHGDGWDAGVERTRGGPSGQRATMLEADKDRDLGAKEREFLANLDRCVFSLPAGERRSQGILLTPVDTGS